MTPLSPYLIVANAFTPTGGMERANHALALHLARRGGEVHLVGHGAGADVLEYGNVRFHRVPRPLGADLLGMPLVDRVGRYWARRVSRMGGRVIVNGGNCVWGDVNWVHYVHAAWGSGWKRRWFMQHEQRALGKARLIVSNSGRTTADVVKYVGVEKRRVVTPFLGVDAERFVPPSEERRRAVREEMGWGRDEKVVLFVGAVSDRRKGFDRLMEAWKRLGDNWRLVTVGADGPGGVAGAAPSNRASRERRPPPLQWLGFRGDVERLMGACDVVVAPSRYESYGLGVHEALCLGTPAVASAQAGVAEVYPESLRALLIENVEDAGEIAARLGRWAAGRAGFRAAALALSDVLRQRTWDVMAGEIVRIIEERCEADRPMICGAGLASPLTGGGAGPAPHTGTDAL